MIAVNYDEETKSFETLRRKSVKNAKKYLNLGDTVLDYGCATGTVAIEIANTVKNGPGYRYILYHDPECQNKSG